MASPQPASGYGSQAPGPSTYYPPPPPPPPHFVYGNHSPAPYPYQYPPSHMHSHPLAHTSPRISGRGSYISPRGGPSYQNFHSVPYPHPHHSPHLAPQQHSPPGTYPPSGPAKYPPPTLTHPQYSPSYSMKPMYPTSWSAQQPLSPMPKQLSLPPPISPTFPPLQMLKPLEHTPPSLHLSNDRCLVPSAPVVSTSDPQQTYVVTLAAPQDSPSPNVSAPHPVRTASDNSKGGWVIWSRRPHDPSHAPGIIISPRARPPQDVIQKAIELSTPPASPTPSVPKELPHDDESKESVPSSPNHTEVLSSAATETTPGCSTAPGTPIPSSPLSTNTSFSMTTSPSKDKSSSVPPQSPHVELVAPLTCEEKTTLVEQSVTVLAALPTSTSAAMSKAPPKSWASLLRPAGTSLSAYKAPTTLPTSSVLGFSIPASPTITASPSNTSDLQALLNNAPLGSFSPLKIHPRGLVNTGNMCFANSVLQILIYCPEFYRLFTELGKHLTGPVVGAHEEDGKGTPLVDATIQFLKEFQPDEVGPKAKGKVIDRDGDSVLHSFIPTYVYDAMKQKKRFDNMRGGQQEDAEEFLGFYLDTLEEELLSIASAISHSGKSLSPKVAPRIEEREEQESQQENGWMEVGRRNRMVVTRTIKSAESPITRIFGGKFRSTLRAPQQKDSVIIEDWRALQLDIQREQIHTINDALQCISAPSSVQVTSPTRPGITLDASQQVLIDSIPPVLVLHIKRFLYDTKANGVVKIGKQVSFGPELEIGSDIMPSAKKGSQSTKYKLFGVLYHHGLSASGGHYTLDVLHPNRYHASKLRESWIRIDDELVSDVRAEDVFGRVDQDDRCAYLLFYRRTSGPISTRT